MVLALAGDSTITRFFCIFTAFINFVAKVGKKIDYTLYITIFLKNG